MANNAHHATLLLTRAPADAARFAASLDPEVMRGVQIIHSPLIEIEGLIGPFEIPKGHAVIFTSAKAVAFTPMGEGRRAFCVGTMTAQAARDRGWDIAQVAPTADDLLASLSDPGPFVHLSGRHQRGDIAETLHRRGVSCDRHVIYEQHLKPLNAAALSALKGEFPVCVPLFSPRLAGQFAAEARNLSQAHVVAISDATAQSIGGKAPASLVVSAMPDAKAMGDAVEKLLQKVALP